MKLVVNVISLFFSDKSVLIDGYQGNANPIFISILLILCIIYIYIVYLSFVNLHWKTRNRRALRKWVQNQIFQSELLC